MPTRRRQEFVLQSIRYFQRQDYPERELVIVDDEGSDLDGWIPDDPRIRYATVPQSWTIGAKRNLGCEMARGDLIAHWDDDDWYHPTRLSAQIAPLLHGKADITGITGTVFFELAPWVFWECAKDLHRRMFAGDVQGGTLVFWRSLWERCARYPNRSIAEDATLLNRAVSAGARLRKVARRGLYLYLRQGRNTWAFECGRFLDPKGWRQVEPPSLSEEDLSFYRSLSARYCKGVPAVASRPVPRASCILISSGHSPRLQSAVRHFTSQDYPHRELVIVEEAGQSPKGVIPEHPRVRRIRVEAGHSRGTKLNIACEAARGDIVVHWDEGDWSSDRRLSCQVERLEENGADVCGLSTLVSADMQRKVAWELAYTTPRPLLFGNTLCYRRALWSRVRFPDLNDDEHIGLLWSRETRHILPLEDHRIVVSLAGAPRVGPQSPYLRGPSPVSFEEVKRIVWPDRPLAGKKVAEDP